MNFTRIMTTIAVSIMQRSTVLIVGGAYGLACDLVRCGLGRLIYVDYDRVDASNPSRQDFNAGDVGRLKIDAIAESLKRIDPNVEVEVHARDVCSIGTDEWDELFGDVDLAIYATDFFPAQARGNIEALRTGTPSMWIGLYRAGRAGEIVFWLPGLACYRCVCGDRYKAFHVGGASVSSEGGTIFDLHLIDAVAGQNAVGILTRGADNRMGRLVEQLGNRSLIQVKNDPEYTLGDKDIFGQYLGNHPANFSWTTICVPMERDAKCVDCRSLPQSSPKRTGS